MRVVIAGGGTAGHVYPGLAVGHELRSRGADVSFLGTEMGVEARLVPDAGFPFQVVRARPFVRRVSLRAARAPFVALSFAETRGSWPRAIRKVVTGNPVRDEILRVPGKREALAKEARGELGLDEHRRTVLVFGGSQGALHIDRAAIGACRLLGDRADLQIVMVTGPAHLEVIRRGLPVGDRSGGVLSVAGGPDGLIVRLIGYLDRMELGYACADLVVARSGATTVAEISACGLPSLLIPYPYATRRHQEANARAMQRAGAASLMLDAQVSSQSLSDRILSLMDHRERLEAMRDRSTAFGKPDAAARLADLVTEAAS